MVVETNLVFLPMVVETNVMKIVKYKILQSYILTTTLILGSSTDMIRKRQR